MSEPRELAARVTAERVFGHLDWAAFSLLSVINILVVGYFVWLWFVSPADGTREHVLFWVITSLGFSALAMYELRWFALPLMVRPHKLPAEPGVKVAVVTTFVPGAEPLAMLDVTLRALAAMTYDHDTWVLDEGDDDSVKALCRELGVLHFSRKSLPHYQTREGVFQAKSKHGNYNAWLHEVGFKDYDALVAFDPDHIPDRNYIVELLGYLRDPRVGYVQAAQVYYNQPVSFVARGAAEETYAYYSSIMMTSYATGFPIITGCHNVHRMTALEEIGGLAPHDADDLLTTNVYRAAGWEGVYVPRQLAVGLTPVDWRGYLKQQRRWARSVLDIKLRVFPRLAAKLPFRERVVSFFHGLYYLHGLATALGIAVLVIVLLTGSKPVPPDVAQWKPLLLLVAGIQVCDFYRQRFYLLPRQEIGLHVRSTLVRFAKWPYVAAALWEAVWNRRRDYEITAKVRQRSQGFATAPHALIAGVVAVAWAVGVSRGTAGGVLVHLITAAFIALSLLVAATELLRYPAPFDLELAVKAAGELEAGRNRKEETLSVGT